MTPKEPSLKSRGMGRRTEHSTFSGVGSSIMKLDPETNVISNKRVFSRTGGIGPSTVGSDEWMRAKEK